MLISSITNLTESEVWKTELSEGILKYNSSSANTVETATRRKAVMVENYHYWDKIRWWWISWWLQRTTVKLLWCVVITFILLIQIIIIKVEKVITVVVVVINKNIIILNNLTNSNLFIYLVNLSRFVLYYHPPVIQ